MRYRKLVALALAAAASMRCQLSSDQKASAPQAAFEAAPADRMMKEEASPSMPARKAKRAPAAPAALLSGLDKADGLVDLEEAGGGGEGQGQSATPSRAWFPETFLFAPLVVTDEQGKAAVPVRVPDRLTSWRVLALAHSRDGAQAGAVATFRGTLPVYVDLVVPPFLMAGDEARLPVQVVNTTGQEVEKLLSVEAEGGAVSLSATRVRVPAHDSRIVYATLRAPRPGTVALRAILGDADAVVRTVPVLATGRPVEIRHGGTLAAPRELKVTGPARLDRDSARVRLLVFPGALALLRSELAAAGTRAGEAEDAYALLLAGRAPKLLESLGEGAQATGAGETSVAAGPEALRNLAILAGQRVVRHGRSPDLATASLLAEAALAHPDNPVLARLGERMAATVANEQRPDGTFGGQSGWTLQRLLTSTADGLKAVRAAAGTSAAARQRAANAAIRASGAFERNLERIDEGYTAAAILASGGVSGKVADALRAKVRKDVERFSDGSFGLRVSPNSVRSDGRRPSDIEASALAVLALEGDADAVSLLADLGARLLGSYSPGIGWGDGRTNLVALQAVLSLFKEPLPKSVAITLSMDGKTVAEGTLDSTRLREVVTLEGLAPDAEGEHLWTVSAQPAVPGLGFSFTLQAWVPWEKQPAVGGLELEIDATPEAKLGQPLEIRVAAAAPAGMALALRHALPAGFQPDRASLERLVADGLVRGYRAVDGAVELDVPPVEASGAFSASYRVIPTLIGTLSASASSLAIEGRPESAHYVPPAVWTVR